MGFVGGGNWSGGGVVLCGFIIFFWHGIGLDWVGNWSGSGLV